ncbi:DUF6344 domain-containing protein [Streptomyces composti]|uniref:DUF6344 domain-containing protein n=1 Tax=Streptomyces composti TaxID=2720025 RepID=UPI001F0E5DDE|nr:DUF6344 domain-containing protein [Streptomyces composti]
MAKNKVMKLWTVIVTAFLALCTALGLATTTASAAVPQTETARNTERATDTAAAPALVLRSKSRPSALPPTMKQRIHAEAHGKSPRCRQVRAMNGTADVLMCAPDSTSQPGTTSQAGTPSASGPSSTVSTPLQR